LGSKTTLTWHSPSGNLASQTDALGNKFAYSYTAQTQSGFTFYNLTSVTKPDGAIVQLTYDGSGNIVTLTDEAGKATGYTYNNRGQVLTRPNASAGMAN